MIMFCCDCPGPLSAGQTEGPTPPRCRFLGDGFTLLTLHLCCFPTHWQLKDEGGRKELESFFLCHQVHPRGGIVAPLNSRGNLLSISGKFIRFYW